MVLKRWAIDRVNSTLCFYTTNKKTTTLFRWNEQIMKQFICNTEQPKTWRRKKNGKHMNESL